MVEDADIYLTLKTFSANLEMAAQQLVKLACDNGGRDNVSVVLAKPLKSFEAQRGFFDRMTDWFS
jgi:protein phosphatase